MQHLASHYRSDSDDDWKPMPAADVMCVTNPFKRRGLATAFVVRRVEVVEPSVPAVGISWYSTSAQSWQDGPLPPRGEFLIKRGGASRLRSVAAILELEPPYLVVLKRGVEAPNT